MKNPSLASYRAMTQEINFTSMECIKTRTSWLTHWPHWPLNLFEEREPDILNRKTTWFDQERVMSPRRLARAFFEGYDPGEGYWAMPIE